MEQPLILVLKCDRWLGVGRHLLIPRVKGAFDSRRHLPSQTLNDDLKAGQEEEVSWFWWTNRSLSVRDGKDPAVELGPKNWH